MTKQIAQRIQYALDHDEAEDLAWSIYFSSWEEFPGTWEKWKKGLERLQNDEKG